MSGSIGVTIRDVDGNEHRMCRWVNSIPDFIRNVKLINKDPKHLDDYLAVWQDMVEEHSTGNYKKVSVASMYAPYPFLAPRGYGMLVVDYKTNTILHSQNYSSLESFGRGHIALAITSADPNGADDPDELNEIKELYDAGRLGTVATWGELLATSEQGQGHPVKIQFNPWTMHEFPGAARDGHGLRDMRQAVKDLGFVLSPEEETIWSNFIKDRRR